MAVDRYCSSHRLLCRLSLTGGGGKAEAANDLTGGVARPTLHLAEITDPKSTFQPGCLGAQAGRDGYLIRLSHATCVAPAIARPGPTVFVSIEAPTQKLIRTDEAPSGFFSDVAPCVTAVMTAVLCSHFGFYRYICGEPLPVGWGLIFSNSTRASVRFPDCLVVSGPLFTRG